MPTTDSETFKVDLLLLYVLFQVRSLRIQSSVFLGQDGRLTGKRFAACCTSVMLPHKSETLEASSTASRFLNRRGGLLILSRHLILVHFSCALDHVKSVAIQKRDPVLWSLLVTSGFKEADLNQLPGNRESLTGRNVPQDC